MPLTAKQKKEGKERMVRIQAEAKKLWAGGKLKKYSDAVSQACKNLKKKGEM
jgi:hypothetical protein